MPLVERQPQACRADAGRRAHRRARPRLLQKPTPSSRSPATDRDPLSGTLKLALIPTVGPYLLPHIAAASSATCRGSNCCSTSTRRRRCSRSCAPGSSISASSRCRSRPRDRFAPSSTRSPSGSPCRLACARRARRGAHRGPARRNGAAARGRPLPARPGARRLQPRAGTGVPGLPRDEPRDPAADGRGRARRDVAAGACGERASREAARDEGQVLREPGPRAYDRRGMAQIEHSGAAIDAIVASIRSAMAARAEPQET